MRVPTEFRNYGGAWRYIRRAFRELMDETRRMVARDLPPRWSVSKLVFDNGDEYGYGFSLWPIGDEANLDRALDVRCKLIDSADYDGGDPWKGVSIDLSIVRGGGEIEASYQPDNFTPQVWSRLPSVLLDRTCAITAAEVAAEVTKALSRKQKD